MYRSLLALTVIAMIFSMGMREAARAKARAGTPRVGEFEVVASLWGAVAGACLLLPYWFDPRARADGVVPILGSVLLAALGAVVGAVVGFLLTGPATRRLDPRTLKVAGVLAVAELVFVAAVSGPPAVRAVAPPAPPPAPSRESGPPPRRQDPQPAPVFSPDGRHVFTAGADGVGYLWETGEGKEARRFRSQGGVDRALAFSRDGRMLVTASQAEGFYTLWDVAKARDLATLGLGRGRPLAAVFLDRGRRLVVATDDGTVRSWDLDRFHSSAAFAVTEESPLTSAAFSPDGRFVLTGHASGSVGLWSMANGRFLREVTRRNGAVIALSVAPDGRSALAAFSAGEIGQLSLDARRSHRWQSAAVGLAVVCFSQNGRMALGVGTDGELVMWNVDQWRPVGVHPVRGGPITAVALAPDGRNAVLVDEVGAVRPWALPAWAVTAS